MAIAHVVWDWNGTLLDDVDACVTALNDILRSKGLCPVTSDQYRRSFRFPVYDFYVELGMTFGPGEWDRLSDDFHRLYREYAADKPLRQGAKEGLQALKERGVAMSILSVSETGLLRHMVDQRGIGHFFQHVIGKDDFAADSKVEAAQQLAALMDGLPPDSVMLVGDTRHDSDVARELGWQCILLGGGHQADDRLEHIGGRIVRDISSAVRIIMDDLSA